MSKIHLEKKFQKFFFGKKSPLMYFLSYVCCVVSVAMVLSNTEKIRLGVVFILLVYLKKFQKNWRWVLLYVLMMLWYNKEKEIEGLYCPFNLLYFGCCYSTKVFL